MSSKPATGSEAWVAQLSSELRPAGLTGRTAAEASAPGQHLRNAASFMGVAQFSPWAMLYVRAIHGLEPHEALVVKLGACLWEVVVQFSPDTTPSSTYMTVMVKGRAAVQAAHPVPAQWVSADSMQQAAKQAAKGDAHLEADLAKFREVARSRPTKEAKAAKQAARAAAAEAKEEAKQAARVAKEEAKAAKQAARAAEEEAMEEAIEEAKQAARAARAEGEAMEEAKQAARAAALEQWATAEAAKQAFRQRQAAFLEAFRQQQAEEKAAKRQRR